MILTEEQARELEEERARRYIRTSIGKNIRRIRRARRITFHDLAQLCNIGFRQFSDIEWCVVEPTAAQLEVIAKNLGVSIDELRRENLPSDNGDGAA